MNFGSPGFAYLLFLLPALALLKVAADARGQKALRAFASPARLRAHFRGGSHPAWAMLRFVLQTAGLGLFVVALTRPQLGEIKRVEEMLGRNVFLAIDTSKSMLADDVSPNRLTRAKLAAQDLLEKLPGDRVGLVAFAGRAFLQAPLTNDHEAVIESIQSLDHTSIPRGGSSLAAAIMLAVDTVEKVKGQDHAMILFTDGQETDDGALEAAAAAAEKRLLILTVGIGTSEGALIPDPESPRPGSFLRDEVGQVIKSRLEPDLLMEIARITGGEYVPLASQALTQSLVDRLLARLQWHKAESREFTKPIERYQWPLFGGIVCLIMSLIIRPGARQRLSAPPPLPVDPHATVHHPSPLRHGATLLLVGLLALAAGGGRLEAAVDKDLKRAQDAYGSGNFEASRNAYLLLLGEKHPPVPKEDLAYGLGAAELQLKNYEHAAKAFSEALHSDDPGLQKQSHRGLGTSLYNQGDEALARQPDFTVRAWTDSLKHFEAALALEPGSQELKANRDFVKKRLEDLQKELEKQRQQQKQQQQQQQQKDKGKGKGEGEPQDSESGDEPQDQPPKDGKEREEKKTDAMKKGEEPLPEGELRAGEAGKPDPKTSPEPQEEPDPHKQNDKTGFSPEEARSRLRTYANDQQRSLQNLMRREAPQGGKDY